MKLLEEIKSCNCITSLRSVKILTNCQVRSIIEHKLVHMLKNCYQFDYICTNGIL